MDGPLRRGRGKSATEFADQQAADPTALVVRHHMEVVDERAPVRVLVDETAGEAQEGAVAILGQGDDLPGSRIPYAGLPQGSPFGLDRAVEIRIGKESAIGRTPARHMQGRDRFGIVAGRRAKPKRRRHGGASAPDAWGIGGAATRRRPPMTAR